MFFRNPMMPMKCLAMPQMLVTGWASTLWPVGQLPLATGRGVEFRLSLSPVVLQGRVVGGVRGPYEPMSNDLCPGEFPQLTFRTLFRTAETILEDPPAERGV